MSSRTALDRVAAATGLSPVEERVALRAVGTHSPPAQVSFLCLTGGKSFILTLSKSGAQAASPVECSDYTYEVGRLRDTISVSGQKYQTALGAGSRARRILAMARLSQNVASKPLAIAEARHIQRLTPLARGWLERWLLPNEELLAWLDAEAPTPRSEHGHQGVPIGCYFVLTERRSALVELSELGDSHITEQPRAALRVELEGRKSWVRVGHAEWVAAKGSSHLYAELAEIHALNPGPRLREVARQNWLFDRKKTGAFVRSVVEQAAKEGDLRADFVALLLALEDGHAPSEKRTLGLASRLSQEDLPADALADLWQRWGFSESTGKGLVTLLRRIRAEPWALELHRRVYRQSRSSTPLARLEEDLELAEHMALGAQTESAIQLLSPHLLDHDGNTAFVAKPDREEELRTRLYELLSRLRGGDTPDIECLLKLLQLRPLSLQRAQALLVAAPQELFTRVDQVVELLGQVGAAHAARGSNASGADGGVSPDSSHLETREISAALDPRVVNEILRHPVARKSPDVLTQLKRVVAEVPMPDRQQLSAFCQRVDAGDFPLAERVVREASLLLQVPELTVFVSRGDKAIGIRAFEDAPPFILIGGSHLDPNHLRYLDETELRFAVGAELGHLRLGHTRVTTSEFWAGALMKTGEGVGLLLSVLPALKGWRLASGLHSALSKLPSGTLERLASSATHAGRSLHFQKSQGQGLSILSEELLEATRMLQLSADRVGLVLCQDLAAAFRGMLKVRPDSSLLLTTLRNRALNDVLKDRDPDVQLGDLELRMGALISFYLSDHFDRICSDLDRGRAP